MRGRLSTVGHLIKVGCFVIKVNYIFNIRMRYPYGLLLQLLRYYLIYHVLPFLQRIHTDGEGSVVSTVDFLVLTSSDQLLFILKGKGQYS
jgi:hypothetical protein